MHTARNVTVRRLRLGPAIALALALGACSVEPTRVTPAQVLLYFDTDAPVPAGSEARRSSSAPLFDRLRIEIYPPDSSTPCVDCTNDFEVNALLFDQKQVSIGIAVPLHVAGFRARARLFKAAFASAAGEPNADSSIEVTVSLPVLDRDVVEERTVMLATDDIGPLGARGSLSAPVDPALGPPGTSRVGTWASAQRVACSTAIPERTVCVPGGAYWMGNPNAPGFSVGGPVGSPRLVVMSPFHMSATEVTVRQFRAQGIVPRQFWTGGNEGASSTDWCTYNATTPGPLEAYPMNCVSVIEARAYCTSLGGDLPTEAQFEYVAGGLVGNLFPWGRDEPDCTDAVFGRGGWGLLQYTEAPCRVPSPGGPSIAGQGARDRVDLPGGSIVDLAGNVSEWVRDSWNRPDEACWSTFGIHRNPSCSTPSAADGPLSVYRGGNWAEAVGIRMLAPSRFPIAGDFANINTGFRCVWP